MRRRKLYRYSQGNSWNPRPRISEYDQKPLNEAEHRPVVSEFDLGVKYGISIARERQVREYAEIRREALVAAKESPYFVLARRGGFEEGFAAGMRAAQNPGQKGDHHFTYADVESARRRGYEEGRSTVSAQRNSTLSADESSIRKRAIEDMLESCRVIAESNPNMNSDSFLKAVRQRSKKIA